MMSDMTLEPGYFLRRGNGLVAEFEQPIEDQLIGLMRSYREPLYKYLFVLVPETLAYVPVPIVRRSPGAEDRAAGQPPTMRQRVRCRG